MDYVKAIALTCLFSALAFSADILPDPSASSYPANGYINNFYFLGPWRASGTQLIIEGYRRVLTSNSSDFISTNGGDNALFAHSYIEFIAPKAGSYHFHIVGNVYMTVPNQFADPSTGKNWYGGATLYLGKNSASVGLLTGKYLNVPVAGVPGTYSQISSGAAIDETIELTAGQSLRIVGIERSEWTVAGAQVSVNVTDGSQIPIPTGRMTISKSAASNKSFTVDFTVD